MTRKIQVNTSNRIDGGKLFQIGFRAGYAENPFFMKTKESIFVTGNQLLTCGVAAATLLLCGSGTALLYFATH